MIILDTNVLSALMREIPDTKVITWLDAQSRTSVWTSSVTVLEIRFGLHIMATGEKRSLLSQAFERLLDGIGHRIAAFDDAAAAAQTASLMASSQRRGRPVELRDTMIAGIVLARHAGLVTRNVAHFEDLTVPVLNPWAA